MSVNRVEDPVTGTAITVPAHWTALEGGGKIPLVAVDRSGEPGAFAPSVVVSVVRVQPTETLQEFTDRNLRSWLVAEPSALVVADVAGELDGLPVREIFMSVMVGSTGVSTFSHFLVTRGLGVRFDLSVEAWDTDAARELARTILAQAQLPTRAPADVSDSESVGSLFDSAIAAAGHHA